MKNFALFALLQLCFVACTPLVPLELDAAVGRLLLENLNVLQKGDPVTSTNHTEWRDVWRGIAGSGDSEWENTKRALSLLVLALEKREGMGNGREGGRVGGSFDVTRVRRESKMFFFFFKLFF
jgi:hypothetical protein